MSKKMERYACSMSSTNRQNINDLAIYLNISKSEVLRESLNFFYSNVFGDIRPIKLDEIPDSNLNYEYHNKGVL